MIGVIGLNHKSASISTRERFSLTAVEIGRFTGMVQAEASHLPEMMVLSTCNRSEFYFYGNACETGNYMLMCRHLARYFSVDEQTIQSDFYHYSGYKAAHHLFRVAAGLDSMLLGEYQIVNQLKEAQRLAQQLGTTGKYLTRLVNKALEAGKSVRSETHLSAGSTSISYVAVEHCARHFEDLPERSVLVVGAGETASLVVKKLEKYGCCELTIANRTAERAVALAGEGGHTIDLDGISAQMTNADIVITALGGSEPIVRPEMMETVLQERGARPMLMIDLGVPRNVDGKVAALEGMTLLNVDDLEADMQSIREKREGAVAEAEDIIEAHALEFNDWLKMQNLAPVIQDIRHGLEQLHRKESRQFGETRSEAEQEMLRHFAEHLSEKYARQLIKNVRKATNNGRRNEFTDLLGDIFKVQ